MSNEEMVERIRNGSGDRQELLQSLYDGNRGLIYRTVRPYISGGWEESDAMQEGFLGLLEAVDRFDPSRGSFASCLCLWVRSVVGRWHSNTEDAKRIPEHMRDRIRKYQTLCLEYQTRNGRDPTAEEIRAALRISPDQLQELRMFIREREPLSLSDPVPGVDGLTIGDCIPDPLENVEQDVIDTVDAERDARRIWERVDALPELQPKVLRLRYQQQETMSKAAEKLGVTCNQIRQQEDKAMWRLRRDRTLRRIAESRGYGSRVYHGSLSRFLLNGSIVEELAMKELEQSP